MGMSENVVKLQNGHFCGDDKPSNSGGFPRKVAENQQGSMDLDSYGIRKKRWQNSIPSRVVVVYNPNNQH
jgi:hypothetical protein